MWLSSSPESSRDYPPGTIATRHSKPSKQKAAAHCDDEIRLLALPPVYRYDQALGRVGPAIMSGTGQKFTYATTVVAGVASLVATVLSVL